MRAFKRSKSPRAAVTFTESFLVVILFFAFFVVEAAFDSSCATDAEDASFSVVFSSPSDYES